MTCIEIKYLLPAYLDGDLPTEEKKSIEEHLSSCILCNQVLADLKKTRDILNNLRDIEPPPFFEQRIMSRIRGEAPQKKGFFRKIFYPLYIKIPIQAMATILIFVLAFYVYQSGDPEIKQIAPIPIPAKELKKGVQTAQSDKTRDAPAAVSPVLQTPENYMTHKERPLYVAPAPEKVGKTEKIADAQTPLREDLPSAMRSVPPPPTLAAKESEIPSFKAEGFSKVRDRAARQETQKVFEILPPEEQKKNKMTDMGVTVSKSRLMAAAPSGSRPTSGAARNASAVDLTIQVRDVDFAYREIEAHLDKINARIIERWHQEERGFLKVEIDAQKAAALLDRLEKIGLVEQQKKSLSYPEGKVIITINIVTHP